jgi:hypothetical protein
VSKSSPSASPSFTSTASSIRSKHGITGLEWDMDPVTREEACDAAVLDLPMWKLPHFMSTHSILVGREILVQ